MKEVSDLERLLTWVLNHFRTNKVKYASVPEYMMTDDRMCYDIVILNEENLTKDQILEKGLQPMGRKWLKSTKTK